jgi:hypothetical protein
MKLDAGLTQSISPAAILAPKSAARTVERYWFTTTTRDEAGPGVASSPLVAAVGRPAISMPKPRLRRRRSCLEHRVAP